MKNWLGWLAKDNPKLVELKEEIDKHDIPEKLLDEFVDWLGNVECDNLYYYENQFITVYLAPSGKEIWWFYGFGTWQWQEYCRKSGWKLLLKDYLKDVFPKTYQKRLEEDKEISATEYLKDEQIDWLKQQTNL